MKRAFSAALFLALAALTFADSWCFVVSGDGRTNDATPDFSGVNSAVAAKLFDAIRAEHPRFLIWTGDLIHGVYGKITAPVDQQLAAWKRLESVATGVDVLAVRGNHETVGDPNGAIWLKSIKPLLDRSKVDYFKGETGFSYSYSPSNDPKTVVIGLDQYVRERRVNLPELERALKAAKRKGAKNIFVFAHEMAFTCTSHGDNENMAKFKSERDAFLELLEMYGVRTFFAGHDHTYDWMEIRHPKWSPDYVLNQIVAGTAGAPFYKDKGYFGDHGGFDLTRKEHRDNVYGYMLVTIDDQENVKIEFKEVR